MNKPTLNWALLLLGLLLGGSLFWLIDHGKKNLHVRWGTPATEKVYVGAENPEPPKDYFYAVAVMIPGDGTVNVKNYQLKSMGPITTNFISDVIVPMQRAFGSNSCLIGICRLN